VLAKRLDGWTVVIAGNWNPAIFTPQWVSSRLTTSASVNVEIRLAPRLVTRLNFDSIYLYLGEQRLTLGVQDSSDSTLSRLQHVAEQILTALPHTPVQGVGVNFQFEDREPSDELLNVFDLVDTTALAKAGAVVETTTITRRLSIAEDVVNMNLAYENDLVRVDLNFHKDVDSAEQARAHIARGMLDFRAQAFRILNSLHGWTIEGD
jgi:hypothetical protein